MIFLCTDFGAADIYVGQVKAVLHGRAPRMAVIDLLHDAPAFHVRAGAHLLAALGARLPPGSVTLAVVDPGVGGRRRPVAVRADGRWFGGPDNGLISVAAARSKRSEAWHIGWRPGDLSASFHGRDLFAPVAAMLAQGNRKAAKLRAAALTVRFGAVDLPEVIYADHFGNLVTGLRARAAPRGRKLRVKGKGIPHARVFSAVRRGEAFWYENSLGLVEIAVNAGSAAAALGARIGQTVRFDPD